MTQQEAIKIFEEKKVRTIWDSEAERWYFSIVDVVSVLTDSTDGRKYWNKLKQRLKEEGNETVTNCHQLKMHAVDGKMRMTDIVDTGQLFRLIQSIPSPKAEPFKLWMAQVTRERLDEMQDPELTIDRAMMEYKRLGYSDNWINQRLKRSDRRTDDKPRAELCLHKFCRGAKEEGEANGRGEDCLYLLLSIYGGFVPRVGALIYSLPFIIFQNIQMVLKTRLIFFRADKTDRAARFV